MRFRNQFSKFSLTGDDTILGDGDDNLVFGAGDDRVDGAGGNDTLDGEGDNDTLTGGIGDDRLIGGIGNDLLDGGAGADTLIGGDGNDIYVVDDAGDRVDETAGSGNDTIYSGQNWILGAGQESLVLIAGAINGAGNDGDNYILGNGKANVLNGGQGNDTIEGDGSNSLFPREGSNIPPDASPDTILGGTGDDYLIGGLGDDSLLGESGHNTLLGGVGYDTLVAGNGGDYLNGGLRYDYIYLGAGADTVALTNFADLTGTDQIYGFDASIDKIDIGRLIEEIDDEVKYEFEEENGKVNLYVYYLETLFGFPRVFKVLEFYDTIGKININNLIITTIDSGDDVLTAIGRSDQLFGYGGNDTLISNDFGSNSLYGGRGDDLIMGGNGGDLLQGGGGNDTIYGGDSNDLFVMSFSDSGVALGRRTYVSNQDTIFNFNADGKDKIDITNFLDVLSYNKRIDRHMGQGFDADTYWNIEQIADNLYELFVITGGSPRLVLAQISVTAGILEQSDFIVAQHQILGDDENNLIQGGSDNEFIVAFGGDDTVTGGDEDDSIHGNIGDDSISGEIGNDYLNGNDGNDTLNGGDDESELLGGLGQDLLMANGSSILNGGEGADTLMGSNFNDHYYIDHVNDLVIESGGIDSVFTTLDEYNLGSNLENVIFTFEEGVEDNDVKTAYGNDKNNFIGFRLTGSYPSEQGFTDSLFFGGGGDDTLSGVSGASMAYGGTGNDSLVGAYDPLHPYPPEDNHIPTLLGGEGNDIYTISHQDIVIIEDIGSVYEYDTIKFAFFTNLHQAILDLNIIINNFHNIESFGFHEYFRGTLIGTEKSDNLFASRDSDYSYGHTLDGRGGNDTLDGGAGADTLIGGSGSDVFMIDNYADRVDASGNVTGDVDTIISAIDVAIGTVNSIAGVTNVFDTVTLYGALANQGDTVSGSGSVQNLILSGPATLAFGNTLDNVIVANDLGNDVFGGLGADTVQGGTGADLFVGQGGNDQLYGGAGGDILTGGQGNDAVYGEVGNDRLFGAGQDDLLVGGDGNDTMLGGVGNDVLYGDDTTVGVFSTLGGADSIGGGEGNETIYGGGGNDTLSGGVNAFTRNGGVWVDWSGDYVHGGAGNDRLTNQGAIYNVGNDTLVGGIGDDTIVLQARYYGQQTVSFDDVVVTIGGVPTIDGVDTIQNFQGDVVDSSNRLSDGRYPGPANDQQDLVDLRDLLSDLGYGADTATRNAAWQAVDLGVVGTVHNYDLQVDINTDNGVPSWVTIAHIGVTDITGIFDADNVIV